MDLQSIVALAARHGASDLHLEPGMPASMRVRGELGSAGERLSAGLLKGLVRQAVGDANWDEFIKRRSHDTARTIAGVRCRLHALVSSRGMGLAIRLLPDVQPDLNSLNLHPALEKLCELDHGLVLISGPTGCGKSSTLAALLQTINQKRAAHVVTIEQPVEYAIQAEKAFIRQREVSRDTPSFEQALLDAMREDPDVIMVGEMQHPETMRLTLNAAETGHLVFATVHSSNVAEALQRMVLAFPSEIQTGMAAQLAGCLQAVVCQKLRWMPNEKLQIPECEILIGNSAARAVVRQSQFFKLGSIMETGASDGMWTRERYRAWMNEQKNWQRPTPRQTKPLQDNPQLKTPTPTTPQETKVPSPLPESKILKIDKPGEDMASILNQLEKSEKN